MLQRFGLFAVLTASVAMAPGLRAQNSTGEIDVSVTDVSEAAIIGARVTITHNATFRGDVQITSERQHVRAQGRHRAARRDRSRALATGVQ